MSHYFLLILFTDTPKVALQYAKVNNVFIKLK